MENLVEKTVKVADLQEICNLLINNGYVLNADPILDQEFKEALRRAELAQMEREIDNPQLISSLRAWRREKAKAAELPNYRILPNRTLLAIAAAMPQTMDALLAIPGFGEKMGEKYGSELLTLIALDLEEG